MQTAVEWLINELTSEYGGERIVNFNEMADVSGYCEQAKEIERNKLVNFLCWYDNLDQHYNSFTQEDYVNKYYNETYGSKGSDEHIVDTNEMISIGDKIRYQKLETIAKLLAKSWFYGDWKWENPNERVQQMLMQELGYYPFKDEDEMIHHTKVDENLYKQASNEIKGWLELPKDISISSQTEISDEEWKKIVKEIGKQPMIFVPNEISDEEIEKWIDSTPYYGHCTPEYKEGLEDGIKWYREQLKCKGNG